MSVNYCRNFLFSLYSNVKFPFDVKAVLYGIFDNCSLIALTSWKIRREMHRARLLSFYILLKYCIIIFISKHAFFSTFFLHFERTDFLSFQVREKINVAMFSKSEYDYEQIRKFEEKSITLLSIQRFHLFQFEVLKQKNIFQWQWMCCKYSLFIDINDVIYNYIMKIV